jgi:hypothetical protein
MVIQGDNVRGKYGCGFRRDEQYNVNDSAGMN